MALEWGRVINKGTKQDGALTFAAEQTQFAFSNNVTVAKINRIYHGDRCVVMSVRSKFLKGRDWRERKGPDMKYPDCGATLEDARAYVDQAYLEKFGPDHEMNTRELGDGWKVKWFWDAALRLWTVTGHDAEGNQVGDADYAPRKAELERTVDYVESQTQERKARGY